MLENLKKLVSYYKPYKKVFLADMFFAIMASFIALLIPLVVRYVTAKVIYMPAEQVVKTMIIIAIVVGILILFQCYCNYYIANYGHVMGAKIEYDMRAEIFGHFQKLSFSFYRLFILIHYYYWFPFDSAHEPSSPVPSLHPKL